MFSLSIWLREWCCFTSITTWVFVCAHNKTNNKNQRKTRVLYRDDRERIWETAIMRCWRENHLKWNDLMAKCARFRFISPPVVSTTSTATCHSLVSVGKSTLRITHLCICIYFNAITQPTTSSRHLRVPLNISRKKNRKNKLLVRSQMTRMWNIYHQISLFLSPENVSSLRTLWLRTDEDEERKRWRRRQWGKQKKHIILMTATQNELEMRAFETYYSSTAAQTIAANVLWLTIMPVN